MNTPTEKSQTFPVKGEMHHQLKSSLAKCPFWEGLREDYQQRLLESAMFQKFAAGERLFMEGDPANRFYVILDGEVALESTDGEKAPVLIQKIGAGDVLGWSWLFPPYYWHFDACATKPTTAIFFYGTRLRLACDNDPGLGYELIKRIAVVVIQRLQATRKELLKT
jgi:CRP/FNR family cyclic AMP-dependent transcriptional regulator